MASLTKGVKRSWSSKKQPARKCIECGGKVESVDNYQCGFCHLAFNSKNDTCPTSYTCSDRWKKVDTTKMSDIEKWRHM